MPKIRRRELLLDFKRQPVIGMNKILQLAALSVILILSIRVGFATEPVRLEVWKAKRELIVWRGQSLLKRFEVSLGRNPVGPKRMRGDGRTPEGEYRIDFKKPNSEFYRALHISYPNTADKLRARDHQQDPGDNLFIHGLPKGSAAIGKRHLAYDWTEGCIALTNEEMDELWSLIPANTKITIHP
jgi:murein L,D-transpeptidase YafK